MNSKLSKNKRTYIVQYWDIDSKLVTVWINAFSSEAAIEKVKSEENDVFRLIRCIELPYLIKDEDL